jgi:hypothetical protein
VYVLLVCLVQTSCLLSVLCYNSVHLADVLVCLQLVYQDLFVCVNQKSTSNSIYMNKSDIVQPVYAYVQLKHAGAIGVKLYNLCDKAHTGLYLEATFKSLCQYNIRQSITAQNKLLVFVISCCCYECFVPGSQQM